MSTNVTFNGTSYQVPQQGDLKWGAYTSRFLTALGTYALAPSGGTFTLTGDVNFGASFGLLSAYFSTRAASPASAGLVRLANGDSIQWRNHAGSGNNVLTVDSSDDITWNGVVLNTALNTLTNGKIWIGNASNTPIGCTLTGDVTVDNTGVTAIGAGKIVNAQVSNSAAIAYSKLSLTASVVNADIASGAAIAFSKLASLTSAHLLVGSAGNVATDVALSGDATLSNAGALTLATVNSNVGSFTNASITVNGKGLITATSSGTAPVTSVTGTTDQITSTGGVTPVLAIANPLTLPGAMTAGGAIAMGANKITGLANGSAATDAAAFGQLPSITDWTDFSGSSTVVGWVATPTVSIRYYKINKLVFVSFSITGTSNSASTSFTIPTNVAGNGISYVGAFVTNSGTTSATPGYVECLSNAVVTVFRDAVGTAWTTTGTKTVRGQFTYQSAT